MFRVAVLIAFFVCLAVAHEGSLSQGRESMDSTGLSEVGQEFLLTESFEEFKEKFGKVYESEKEEKQRFEIFSENMDKAARWNLEGETDVFGITKFSDMSEAEMRYYYLNYRPSLEERDVPVHSTRSSVPTNWDWRDESGVLTPVKNQEQCGSCWAFSAVETVESAWALAGNSLTVFSEQQVVSCDSECYGCGGGWTEKAYDYIESAGGLATEADYPYTSGMGVSGVCKSFTTSGGDLSGYEYATSPCTGLFCNNQDLESLASNLASEQPISVCVDASKWSAYRGGVMKASSCSSSAFAMDHCVQLVGYEGYDTSSGYWIVRNSWGVTWGEKGYIYLEVEENTCGVANDATMVNF